MSFTLRLPASLDRELTRQANERRIPKAVLVEKVLREWLQRELIWQQSKSLPKAR